MDYGNQQYPSPYPYNYDPYLQNYWNWQEPYHMPPPLPQPPPPRNMVHVNPAFYQNGGAVVNPVNKKIIVNPKFFPAVLSDNQVIKQPVAVSTPKTQPPKPKPVVPDVKHCNKNKYSWQKLDSIEISPIPKATKMPLQSPVRVGVLSRYRLVKGNKISLNSSKVTSPPMVGTKSRFKVDNRSKCKSGKAATSHRISLPKCLNTKYKIIRKSNKSSVVTPRKVAISNRHKISRLSVSRSFTNFKSPLLQNSRTLTTRPRSKWHQRVNTIKFPGKKFQFVRSITPKMKHKKKKSMNAENRRRYYEEKAEKTEDPKMLDSGDIEIGGRPGRLENRLPIGDLPSFITLT